MSDRWDIQADAQAVERRATLEELREQLLERKYIDNLLAAIEREAAGSGLSALGSGQPETVSQRPEPKA